MIDELTTEQRDALRRHGYDPDLPPRGISGPPDVIHTIRGDLRNHVCALDGIEIDGHESSDLDPRDDVCIQCGGDRWEFDRDDA